MAALRNPHPGIILKEEFIDDLGLTQNTLVKAIRVPQNHIREIIRGVQRITALRPLISASADISDSLRVSGCAFRTPMT